MERQNVAVAKGRSRIALVIGGASCVWDDVEAALELGEYDGAVACNDAAAAWPGKLDAAVSLHAEKWGFWMERRRRAGLPPPAAVIGHSTARTSILRLSDCITGYADQMIPGQTDTGSSGLFALKVAIFDLGFDRAVLCGIPMDPRPHFFDTIDWGDSAVRAHWRGWQQALPVIKDKTRSMSGRTRDLLGAPSPEWLTD